jgi:hypothetical protein
MAKNEHAAALAKCKTGMRYKVSEAGREANRRNLEKARAAKVRKREGK